jgi:hypothetical protein
MCVNEHVVVHLQGIFGFAFFSFTPMSTQPLTTRKRAPRAKVPNGLRVQQKVDAQQRAKDLADDIELALVEIDDVVDTLAQKHNKTVEFVQEQLHLGGHVLKQQRAPGINNAFAYCEARCESDECGSSIFCRCCC